MTSRLYQKCEEKEGGSLLGEESIVEIRECSSKIDISLEWCRCPTRPHNPTKTNPLGLCRKILSALYTFPKNIDWSKVSTSGNVYSDKKVPRRAQHAFFHFEEGLSHARPRKNVRFLLFPGIETRNIAICIDCRPPWTVQQFYGEDKMALKDERPRNQLNHWFQSTCVKMKPLQPSEVKFYLDIFYDFECNSKNFEIFLVAWKVYLRSSFFKDGLQKSLDLTERLSGGKDKDFLFNDFQKKINVDDELIFKEITMDDDPFEKQDEETMARERERLIREEQFLTSFWEERIVGGILETLFNDFPRICYSRKEEPFYIYLWAHNGGRFDLILLFKFLNRWFFEKCHEEFGPLRDPMKEGEISWRAVGVPRIIQNNGRILSADFDLVRNRNLHELDQVFITIAFRDTVIYCPTGSRALSGCAKELKLPQQKQDCVYYLWMDIIYQRALIDEKEFNFFNETELRIETENRLLKRYPNRSTLPDHEKTHLADVFREKYHAFVEAWKEENCNGMKLILTYCRQDVVTLAGIHNYLFQTLFYPNLHFFLQMESQTLNSFCTRYQTMSSMMLHELLFQCINPLDPKQRPASLHVPFGKLNKIQRRAIFGGRVSSPRIGVDFDDEVKRCHEFLWKNEDNKVMVLNAVNDLVKGKPNKNQKNWKSLKDVSTQEWLSQKEIFKKSLFPLAIHLDVCSQYPSALVAPQPDGKARLLNEDEIQNLQSKLNEMVRQVREENNLDAANHFFLPPFWAECEFSFPKEKYDEWSNDCHEHWRLQFSTFPWSPRNTAMDTYLFSAGDPTPDKPTRGLGRLLYGFGERTIYLGWIFGKKLKGAYSSIDIIHCIRNGWSVEIFNLEEREVYVYDELIHDDMPSGCSQSWHPNYTASFFRAAAEKKMQAEQDGNPALRIFFKTIMNGSYGGNLYDKTTKTSFQYISKNPFEEDMKDGNLPTSILPVTSTERMVSKMASDIWSKLFRFPNDFYLAGYANKDDPKCKNTKMAFLGGTCLSGSRIIFNQMLHYCIRESQERKSQPLSWSQHYYADTDSLTTSFLNALHVPQEVFAEPTRLGSAIVSRGQYDFTLALECASESDKFCPWWFSKGGWKLPCFSTSAVFAKKVYIETCQYCEKSHIRAKGHNLADEGIQKRLVDFDFQSFLFQRAQDYPDQASVSIINPERFVPPDEENITGGEEGDENSQFSWNFQNKGCPDDDVPQGDSKTFTTERSTLKVHLPRGQSNPESTFTISSVTLDRHLNIVRDAASTQCTRCKNWFSIFIDHDDLLSCAEASFVTPHSPPPFPFSDDQ
jgi:hypothetical protein